MRKLRKNRQKRCNRCGYTASFKFCPLEHSPKRAVFFYLVLDALAKSEKRLRAGLERRQYALVGARKVVRGWVVNIGGKVREYHADIVRIGAAVNASRYVGVVVSRIGYPRRLIVGKI